MSRSPKIQSGVSGGQGSMLVFMGTRKLLGDSEMSLYVRVSVC